MGSWVLIPAQIYIKCSGYARRINSNETFVMLTWGKRALWTNTSQQSMKGRKNSNVTFVMQTLDKEAIWLHTLQQFMKEIKKILFNYLDVFKVPFFSAFWIAESISKKRDFRIFQNGHIAWHCATNIFTNFFINLSLMVVYEYIQEKKIPSFRRQGYEFSWKKVCLKNIAFYIVVVLNLLLFLYHVVFVPIAWLLFY